MPETRKTGLVLTGGGLKGICAQTGALLALKDKDLHFEAAIGTSAGAIVGSFFTSGIDPERMARILGDLTRDDYLDPLFDLELDDAAQILDLLRNQLKGVTGYFQGHALRGFLAEHLGRERIEQCEPRFFITLTNISRGIPEVWGAGPLSAAARASSAIPVVFAAEEITDAAIDVHEELYVDGGAVNNVPVDELDRKSRQPGSGFEIEQYLVLTTLGLERTPPRDNSFRDESWAPLRVLLPTIDAVANDQHLNNLTTSQGKQVMPLRIETEAIDLDEPELIASRIEQARVDAAAKIAQMDDFFATVPHG